MITRLSRRVLLAVLAAIVTGTSSQALAPNPASAQGATSLTFARPAAQGPGTPGFQAVSDPTIQPFLVDGVAAYLGTTVSIDLQGNGFGGVPPQKTGARTRVGWSRHNAGAHEPSQTLASA